MAFLPIGRIIILLITTAIFLGWARRALDNMRLTDTMALVLLAAMFAGTFLPDIYLGAGIRIGFGGALVPLGICVYLITTADEAYERRRSLVAALITAAVVFGLETVLPPEPGALGRFDLDPLWLPAFVAAFVGYLAGRSRRASFIAGVLGVILADIFAGVANVIRGVPGAFAAIGRGGVFDGIVLAGFLAVLLAELFGESREFLARRSGRPSSDPSGDADDAPDDSPDDKLNAAQSGGTGRSILDSSRGTTLSLIFALVLSVAAVGTGDRLWREGEAHRLGAADPYRLIDEAGRLITTWGHPILPQDEYIDSANRWYRVTRVDGRIAFAQTLGQFSLSAGPPPLTPVLPTDPSRIVPAATTAQAARRSLFEFFMGKPAATKERILLLHTHNGESYVRSDGEDMAEGRGGIHKVGAALAKELTNEGFAVTHDQNIHLPHDRGAYRRSRQTIIQQLRSRPAVVIDVHRDAVPPQEYAYEIDGQGVTKVRLVVGRQNPNGAQNLRFARQIKSVADELYPGLVHGIFFGRGNYNQDLGPRVMLFEMGAHTNARESAERSTQYMAKVLRAWFDRHFED